MYSGSTVNFLGYGRVQPPSSGPGKMLVQHRSWRWEDSVRPGRLGGMAFPTAGPPARTPGQALGRGRTAWAQHGWAQDGSGAACRP